MMQMVILAVAVIIPTGAVIALLLSPAFFATRDWSGAVDVTAVRGAEGVRVVLDPFPLARGAVIHSVAVSREIADELDLDVPEGFRVSLDRRWLAAEGDRKLSRPVELLFKAGRETSRPIGGHVRVTSSYRPAIRRMRHATQVGIETRRTLS